MSEYDSGALYQLVTKINNSKYLRLLLKIDKQKIIEQIIAHIDEELKNITLAAESARLAAIDDQSVAETQYDTLAIEASYLAHGHSERAQQLINAKGQYQNIKLRDFNEDDEITQGALLQLGTEHGHKYFFIAPNSGGLKVEVDGKNITVITETAPLTQQLLGLYQDDDIELTLPGIAGTNMTILSVK